MTFPCDYCDKAFVRSSHLSRHRKTHISAKQYQCSTCQKIFDRRDTLLRHEAIHAFTENVFVHTSAESNQTPRNSRPRACLACSKARSRCSKGKPSCTRCRMKSIACQYTQHDYDAVSSKEPTTQADSVSHGGCVRKDIALLTQCGTRKDSVRSQATSPILPSCQATADLQAETLLASWQEDSRSQYHLLSDARTKSQNGHARAKSIPAERMPADSGSQTSVISSISGMQLDTSAMSTALSQISEIDVGPITPYNWISVDNEIPIDYETIAGLGSGATDAFVNLNSTLMSPDIWQEVSSQFPHHGIENGQDTAMSALSSVTTRTPIVAPSQIRSILDRDWRDRYGALYADCSDGARLVATTNLQHETSNTIKSGSVVPSPALPQTLKLPAAVVNPSISMETIWSELDLIAACTYAEIQNAYTELANLQFLTKGCANYLILLYFQHFHDSFPILHKPTHRLDEDWRLTLTLMAIGCQYTRHPVIVTCIQPLQAFLQEVLVQKIQPSDISNLPLSVLQAVILQDLSLVYNRGAIRNSILVNSKCSLDPIWQRSMLLRQARPQELAGIASEWADWIVREAWIRLRYAIWLLDSMRKYTFGNEQLFNLKAANHPLPNDYAWEARSASDWSTRFKRTYENQSLANVVRHLIASKSLNVKAGYFAKTLILHGLYCEFTSISHYLACSPSHDDTGEAPTGESSWLPSIAAFARWRNNACDCVDALHWTANSETALARGLEHPLILQLHMARILLLVPHQSIRILARASSMFTKVVPLQEPQRISHASSAEQEIIRWAQQDEHKARLAVLHAASCYWHVQRFSTRSFMEPAILYLATLTLWAYVSYTPISRPSKECSADSAFIRLDRPCDDEIIQSWIRHGRPSTTKAFIADVGDIFDPGAPDKLLQKGCKMLAEMQSVWNYADDYINCLQNLLRTVRFRRSEANTT